jgi:23S rRNA pseudouridine1911/1915/1917 synthase
MTLLAVNDEDGSSIELASTGFAGERLDRFLAQALPQYSRTRIQRWIELGAVRWDERILGRRHRLLGVERVTVEPQPLEAEQAFGPEPVEFEVHDSDESLLVINKHAGLVVHPAAGNWQGTLLNGLLYRFRDQAALPRGGIVHRLDRDTSGLMVVARNEQAMSSLGGQLAERSMGRRYLALVQGRTETSGVIEAPLARDPSNRLRFTVTREGTGKNARTDFVRLAEGSIGPRPVSLVECRLHTGRTHQIRVHMRHIGHSIVADALYGGLSDARCARQALHAWQLALLHPASAKPVAWRVRPPADMREVIQAAGIDLESCVDAGR